MDHAEMTTRLLEEVGGPENVRTASHCMTRLRLVLVDRSAVDTTRIAAIDGVIAASFSGDELQVVVGTQVPAVYAAFRDRYRPAAPRPGVRTKEDARARLGTGLNAVVGFFGAVFVPILPALIGAGLAKSLLVLLDQVDWVAADSAVWHLLTIVSDGAFYFLPFLLAVSAARRLEVSEYLAIPVAAGLLYPTVVNGLADGGDVLRVAGVDIPLMSYAASVIPILLGVVLLRLVSRGLERVVPQAVQVVVVPLVSLLVVIPLTLAFLAPLGFRGGELLSDGVTWIFDTSGVAASAVTGAVLPVLILTGMHHVLGSIILSNLTGSAGVDSLLPLFFLESLAMSGAAIAVFVRARRGALRASALSTGMTAFLGITEPATYGVNLPLRRPFVAAMVGTGVAGGLGYLLGMRAFAYTMPSVLSIPTYVRPQDGSTLAAVLVSAAVAFGLSFAITYLWWRRPADEPTDGATAAAPDPVVVRSPVVDGRVLDTATVPDEVFRSELLGPTVAIAPLSGSVVAPVDGTVVLVSPTRHAVGLRTDGGVEVLLHLGIDTVTLDGSAFAVAVSEGHEVVAGQEIVVADFDRVRAAGLQDTVLLAVTAAGGAAVDRQVTAGTRVTATTPVFAIDGATASSAEPAVRVA
ncbi:glucose PTS transporter subunit IIA [Cellulosimicrobium cellulans]|uniref:glucose PTS transporter subunit IIA n=1 Tax=Cellulosimicrobium cellulans TaxID=1710 RepID=UPI00130EDDE3|nr:glucose PTS transporter subunit IIA [Cellulosimicrobium cellulans]